MGQFDADESGRLQRYQVLYDALKDLKNIKVYPLPETGGSPFVFPLSLIDSDARSMSEKLFQKGVAVRSLMGGSIGDQPGFKFLENDGLYHTRDIGRRSFFVGIHQTLPLADVEAVAQILRETLKGE